MKYKLFINNNYEDDKKWDPKIILYTIKSSFFRKNITFFHLKNYVFFVYNDGSDHIIVPIIVVVV